MKVSLDKIAKKNEGISLIKKPWGESPGEGDKGCKNNKNECLKTERRPRFEIPESNKKKLKNVSQSLDFLFDIVKM